MLDVSQMTLDALSDSGVVSETLATAVYQDKSANLTPTDEGDIAWSADGDLQAVSSLHLVGWGDSLVPKGARDALLAPYGQEVQLVRRVHLRNGLTTGIPLGVYRVTGNDGGRESVRGGRVLDWELNVSLADRFRLLQRSQIIDPASPSAGATVFSELQRLALFPLVLDPAIADAEAPRSMVYDNRLSGVHQLASLVGAKPRINRQGALTLRPADRWATETVLDFDLPGSLSANGGQTDEFYNYVLTHNDKGEFTQFAAILDDSNPLSVNRAGASTYEHSSPAYVSNSASLAGAQTILARLSNRRSSTVTAELDARGLLLELSDYGRIYDPEQNRSVIGEVSRMTVPHDPTARISVELIIAEES